jgi:hypothetical protein
MVSPRKPKSEADEIELHPDAWERFTEFVKRIAKAGPQHRVKRQAKERGSKSDKSDSG